MKPTINPCTRMKISIYLIFIGFGLCGITQLISEMLPGVQFYLEMFSILSLVLVIIVGIPYLLYASRQYQISQGLIDKNDPFTL